MHITHSTTRLETTSITVDDLVSRCLGGRRARRMHFYFLPEHRETRKAERGRQNERRYYDNNGQPSLLVRIRTHASFSLHRESSRLLTQFFASLYVRSSSFSLFCASLTAHDFASTSSASSSSSSAAATAVAAAAAALPSSPSAPSRGYVQARCIPEPREWKDLVKVSRSLAYA